MRMRRLRADLQSTKEDLQRTMQTHTEFVVQSGRSVRSESVLAMHALSRLSSRMVPLLHFPMAPGLLSGSFV